MTRSTYEEHGKLKFTSPRGSDVPLRPVPGVLETLISDTETLTLRPLTLSLLSEMRFRPQNIPTLRNETQRFETLRYATQRHDTLRNATIRRRNAHSLPNPRSRST
jgi:hypothetical protein